MLRQHSRIVLLVAVAATAGCHHVTVAQGGPGLPQARFASSPDYPGYATQLDGRGSSDPAQRALTYRWHFAAVPAGSHVDDAALGSATTALTTFMPDLGGRYTVTLTVDAGGGYVDAVTHDVVVPVAPVFYMNGDVAGASLTTTANVVNSDGSNDHALSCPLAVDAGSGSGDAALPTLLSGFMASRAFDGAAAAFVFAQYDVIGTSDNAAGVGVHLFLANPQTSCGGRAPLQLDGTIVSRYGPAPQLYLFPRFSPDGKRVLMISTGVNVPLLITVGIDGSNLHVVHTDSGNSMAPIPPLWVNGTTVAWAQNAGTSASPRWQVLQAADSEGAGDAAGLPPLIDCTGGSGTPVLATVSQLELANGVLFVGGAISGGSDAVREIYRMTPGRCATDDPLAGASASRPAHDFALSPDGQTILFTVSYLDADMGSASFAGDSDIYAVNAVGAPLVKQLAGAPGLPDLGPRWIAGGKQFVWTQLAATPADMAGLLGPPGASIMMANADGSLAHLLVAHDGASGHQVYAMAGGNFGLGCDLGSGAGTGAGVLLALALLVALLWRRRRATGCTCR